MCKKQHNESIERLKEGTQMNKKESHPPEPYYYVALVLKSTEKQYLNLLKHVEKQNSAKLIYQCKSLTYLRVTRDEGIKFKVPRFTAELVTEPQESSS